MKPPPAALGKPGDAMIVYTARFCEAMPRTKVGMGEFRANLASILESKTPVTVTRHGETPGVFLPVDARPKPANLPGSVKPNKANINVIGRADAEMDTLIGAIGTTAKELIAEFEKARREKRASRTRA